MSSLTRTRSLALALGLIAAWLGCADARAQGTTFTYQGRLIDAGIPATGIYDLRFTIWDSSVGGSQVGFAVVVSPLAVTNGIFTVALDFGVTPFTGPQRWLQIESRAFGGPAYFPLNPRQQVTATPYAILAGNISGTVADANLGSNVALLNRNPQTFTGANNFNNTVSFPDPTKALLFPPTAGANVPMITMFSSGTANADRMVIGHSPSFSNWGLQYQDTSDRFRFLSAGSPVLTIDLGFPSVGIDGTAAIRGSASITGTLGLNGNLNFVDQTNTIQFPATSGPNAPMINMFASGTGNADRMVIAHSPAFPTYGLQYQDSQDKFNFLSSGFPVLSVDLGSGRVGIGTSAPTRPLDVQAFQAVGRFVTSGSPNGSVIELQNTGLANYLGAINFLDTGSVPVQIGGFTNGDLAFRAGNQERVRITAHGDLTINAPTNTIQFPATTNSGVPMITMFDSGTGNADRMVIGHSPSFPTYGLQYQDSGDRFRFLSGGFPVMTVDLGSDEVAVRGNFGVAGNINISNATTTIQFPATSGANSPMITMFASGTVNSDRMVIAHSPSFLNYGLQYQDSSDKFNFLSAGSPVLTVDLGLGRVGIGTASPSFQLQLTADSAAKPNGGSWANSSDARVKKNVLPMTGALEKLTRLRGVTFEWINPEDHAGQTGTQAGFIAQEVESAFPSWVKDVPGAEHDQQLTPDGKIKSMSLPFEFDALVVESIRELRAQKDAQITSLEKANADLKKELAAQQALTRELQNGLAQIKKAMAKFAERSKPVGTFAFNPEPPASR